MNASLFLSKRIIFNQQKAFSNFIIQLSVAAVAISTGIMVIAICFINGFQTIIQNKAFSFWGHLRVEEFVQTNSNISINQHDTTDIATLLNQIDGVEFVHRYNQKYGIVIAHNTMEGIVFKGYDTMPQQGSILSFLIKGRWVKRHQSVGDANNYATEIVLSEYAAQRLQLDTGQFVIANFIEQDRTQRKRKLKIVGVYQTHIQEYDKTFAFIDFALIEKMQAIDNSKPNTYEIIVQNASRIKSVNEVLYTQLPTNWDSKTTQEIVPQLFDWLALLNVNKWVLIIILSLVATINIIACMVTFVLERSRMIGILKAFGYPNTEIQKVFIYYATYVSLKGIFIGIGSGLLLCIIQQLTGFIQLNPEVYFVAAAPVKIIPMQIIILFLSAVAICFLILILPSYFIQKLKPIKSIQIQA